MSRNYSSIEFLKSVKDVGGLQKALRSPGSSALRVEAAQALGELGDIEAVESLVRSMLEDPDRAVQAASSAALTQLLGSNAALAIASYRSGPPDPDPWIQSPPSGSPVEGTWQPPYGEDQSQTAGDEETWRTDSDDILEAKNGWKREDIDGLLALLRSDTPEMLRLRAIQVMKSIPDARVVDALASVSLEGEGEAVRRSAREALEDLVGDNLEEVLQDYLPGGEYEEEDEGIQYLYLENAAGTNERDEEQDGDEENLEEDEPKPEPVNKSSQSTASIPITPVIQEEKPVGQVVLLIFIIIVAVVAGYYFSVR